MIHYNSYRQFIKKKFGSKVLKVPLNGGFSCPNRDGKKSFSGCSFCDNQSFSPAALKCENPREQLLKVMQATAHRFKLYIPYLQPFSNTYGTVDELSAVYEPLLTVPGVVGLAVGTRPDCFSDEIYEYLADLNKRTYLSVELGLQSSHDATLRNVNRGHSAEDFAIAARRLNELGIEVVAHVILGLPGENIQMTNDTARFLSKLPVNGIKIHQLMIIKGTVFENLYNQNKLQPLELEQYAEVLCEFLTFLRPDQLIHRIMADSKPEHGLIAPMWSAEKSASIAEIHRIMGEKKFTVNSSSENLQ